MPSSRNSAKAFISSAYDVRANCDNRTYPVSPLAMNADSMLSMGMASRTTVTSTGSSMPRLCNDNRTSVPRGPRRRFTMSFCGIFTPATVSPSMRIMRSPAAMPALALGPLGITLSTITVSVAALNMTPMPSNSPSKGSFTSCISRAGM